MMVRPVSSLCCPKDTTFYPPAQSGSFCFFDFTLREFSHELFYSALQRSDDFLRFPFPFKVGRLSPRHLR